MSPLLKINWKSRTDALAPSAVVAFDMVAMALAERLITFEDDKLYALHGVSADGMILLTGHRDDLPWTNGVTYLGRDEQMPSALLPTTLRPSIPYQLFERVINKKFSQLAPFALLPDRIIPFGEAKTLSREALANWVSKNR